ncbi:hypothetical protein BMS3Bbin04_00751 [bacterium BMS3Bbin04]|nr:hypothetical protein BMS3Bbin04_00751 [bacterium BMS3Bbin04]
MNKILKAILLWVLALVLTLTALVYQRLTGPTYPVSGEATVAGELIEYELLRSHARNVDPDYGMDHVVRIPISNPDINGTMFWKRLGIDEPFTEVSMTRDGDELIARLPAQPPAGKLVYHVDLIEPDGSQIGLPGGDETITLRFKDPEPLGILIPHIICMFLALLFGVRTLLSVFSGESFKFTSWGTLIFLIIGGVVLGPLLQKAAFGDYWTGWPFGADVTDNKLALAFVAWIVAVWRLNVVENQRKARIFVIVACLVLFSVFLIPHSLGGSTFNYDTGAVDTGL